MSNCGAEILLSLPRIVYRIMFLLSLHLITSHGEDKNYGAGLLLAAARAFHLLHLVWHFDSSPGQITEKIGIVFSSDPSPVPLRQES